MFYGSESRGTPHVRREINDFNKDNRPGFAELKLTMYAFLLSSIAAEFCLAHLV
jgi:hypothetical protein